MERDIEGSSLLITESFLNEPRRVEGKQDDLSVGDKTDKISNLDLELAAEIGKVLLEKNRELELLLRSAQEYTEEQVLKAQFLEQQVDYLKDSLHSQTKAFEHIETQNHELTDLNTQLKSDYKAAYSKNKRLWETIETLEKKCENYKFKIDILEEEKLKYIEAEKKEDVIGSKNEENSKKLSNSDDDIVDNEIEDLTVKAEQLEEKIKSLQETTRDMRVQQNLDQIEKEELKAELEDISTENQLLQHRLSNLEIEVEEWQGFANKAQKYKKLADRYCSNADISFSSSTSHLVHGSKRSDYAIAKSCSHEVLTNSPLCEPSELLASKRHISASVSHLNQLPKNLSVLSEMDNQYHELVKRYEQLLDKYDNGNETATARTQKVQRAIQTLSWDFSCVDVQTVPLSPERRSSCSKDIKCAHCDLEDEDVQLDFRKLFVEIFAKLKSSKDFDPEEKIGNESD